MSTLTDPNPFQPSLQSSAVLFPSVKVQHILMKDIEAYILI